ncbi:hypothetical protein [Natrialbaceae archaeon AArc-T1-2]|uniref:hypothetical protein n=1 Tax=Natrialbaceae archaeon AArc-T1-2 TaxID=3053904 RepID=UPI00255A757A|nr:hypothetical protein [Natrialbaceae archaeon AArc-T1-2]WIV68350.1 hypothetical protein QQ977_06415 [Natrialbaceae archaeon AArc-T1-2]
MAVTLPESMLTQYVRFSLYNSPYRAHDEGRAIDCYPGTLRDGRTTAAPSPVSGTVLETRTVRAPSKPYAPAHDHLLLLACDGPGDLEGLVARILHVDPAVSAGDRVAIGEELGTLVRAGFFAPWVDNHLHVGFREPTQNLHRAAGSLPLEVGVDVSPLSWDGTGTVVATGETYAVLDAPRHPDPGAGFVGIGADGGGVLDGGVPHYDGGGLLAGPDGPVRLNGDRLGVASPRTVTWDDVVVTVDGEPVTGLSTFCARDAGFGAKLICPDRSVSIGEDVRVRVEPA